MVLDDTTPTRFVDYCGALRRGHTLLAENGEISLDTGDPLFEFAPLLVSLLEPWPEDKIILATSWLNKLSVEQVISYLPLPLAKQIVGTPQGYKAGFGDVEAPQRVRDWNAEAHGTDTGSSRSLPV